MMIQTTTSAKSEITNKGTFRLDDIYDISEKKYSRETYKEIITSYFEELRDYIVETGVDVNIPFHLGSLSIKKEKVDYIVNEDGSVRTNSLVNLKRTIELRKEDKDIKPIRHLDVSWVLTPVWNKSQFKNRMYYYFKKSGEFSKILYERAINNKIQNINELHRFK